MNYYKYNYVNPVNIPTYRTYINPLNGRKNVPLKNLIRKAEHSLDTINSFIPLYQKVKPYLSQGKNFLSGLNTFLKKEPIKNNKNNESIKQEDVIVNNQNDKQIINDYRKNQDNNSPFFFKY